MEDKGKGDEKENKSETEFRAVGEVKFLEKVFDPGDSPQLDQGNKLEFF